MTAVRLAAMPHDRLPDWIETSKSDYRDDRMRAGDTLQQATDDAEISFTAYFPGGIPAPNHHVYDVYDSAVRVGSLWIGPQSLGNDTDWWVWDVAIEEQFRGRGFGRAAMESAEREVISFGGTVLGLNVFGFNTPGRRLYESLGYRTTSVRMHKNLTDGGS
ncbi:MAG: GNAT family N-acetyltransferase [Rhodococcus sp. (in: high G+C Gram-positive bacteria)]